jgi:hypothetical protein
MHRRVADDAVALADGVVEAGQPLPARGGLDPQAELVDLDGLRVEVHAVEVVLQNLPVEVEEGALSAQFLQPGVAKLMWPRMSTSMTDRTSVFSSPSATSRADR